MNSAAFTEWVVEDAVLEALVICEGPLGTITAPPNLATDDAPGLWIAKEENPMALRVGVRLSEEEGMLRRLTLEHDPQLQRMRILSFRSQTNYELDPRHARRLAELWRQSKVSAP